ncbi:hypothetical protein BN14_05651 [Rhizoctonia solani AG-1 IB]|uniref:Tryptophan synthase beta chain-like PALP domain-containing protein n=1 Tax=Thanatephorus cucumeris (strain AG1-IB / isolate 7/3/14) TaxID=1108050 RepID=M5BYF5_THACB|nr:hypothetical protein BN14_05651 [Rhizoctonia solani AG-1 IB]
MNVFSGKTALLDFYNPDKNPPLPLVELPSHPFEGDNVRIYAKMLTLLPAGNVKSLPALNMLMRASEAGEVNDSTERIVEYSSGNTVISLGIVSKIMGGPQVGAYISNKTSPQKMELLRFFGLDLTLFGGPAQVEPADVNGGIYAAIQDDRTSFGAEADLSTRTRKPTYDGPDLKFMRNYQISTFLLPQWARQEQ